MKEEVTKFFDLLLEGVFRGVVAGACGTGSACGLYVIMYDSNKTNQTNTFTQG